MDAKKIEACARAASEVARNYSYATGQPARPPLDEDRLKSMWLDVAKAMIDGTLQTTNAHPVELSAERPDADTPWQFTVGYLLGDALRSASEKLDLLKPKEHRPKRTAQELYDHYVQASGGLNFQGNPCPKWDELPAKIRGNWEAVASYVG